ncbi:MAG: hypothetical protein H8E13_00235 [Actinobacteria bacterium]|nr:hypothetical protein [Actinomycetota bacterium]
MNKLISLFKDNYHNLDGLKKAVNSLEYYLMQIMIFDIANEDFIDEISNFKKSLYSPTKTITTGPAKSIPFPKFKTIYFKK